MMRITVDTVNRLRGNARKVVRELGLLNDAFSELNITLAERHLLIELQAKNFRTASEIKEQLLLDKSTISRLVARAKKKGYICCTVDENDKRRRVLVLTEQGRAVLDQFESIAFKQTRDALLTLARDEVEVVDRGIALYAKGLNRARIGDQLCESSIGSGSPIVGSASREGEQKILSLQEVHERLRALGYDLQRYDEQDEEGAYQIFREVVESGTQFPYECSSVQEFRRQFLSSEREAYVSHSYTGEVVACFYLKSNYAGRSSHIANAAYMVASDHRGKGVGALLVKASLRLAKNMGAHALLYNMVLSRNVVAVALYKRLGFTIVGTIPGGVRNPDGTYQDGYVMYRSLDNL